MSTPAEYVAGAFKSRTADATVMLEAFEDAEDMTGADEALTAIEEYPLEITVVRHVEILLSTGGPGEWIDVELDADGSIARGTFVAVWGSERSEYVLNEDDALWTLAQRYVDAVTE